MGNSMSATDDNLSRLHHLWYCVRNQGAYTSCSILESEWVSKTQTKSSSVGRASAPVDFGYELSDREIEYRTTQHLVQRLADLSRDLI